MNIQSILRVRPWSLRTGVLTRRKRDVRQLSLPFSLSPHVHTEGRPCENRARKQPSASQVERPPPKQALMASPSGGPSFRNYEKVNVCYSSHPPVGFCNGSPRWLILYKVTVCILLHHDHAAEHCQITSCTTADHASWLRTILGQMHEGYKSHPLHLPIAHRHPHS